jgi:hypothetical protein
MMTMAITLTAVFISILAGGPVMNNTADPGPEKSILGEWVRMSPMGPIGLTFKSDGTVEGDLGRDNSVDIVSEYSIRKGKITFQDKDGVTCPGAGIYQLDITDHYVSFDPLKDNCGGRVKSTMGFWVRHDFEDRLKDLTETISKSNKPEDYLSRGRMYMALARSDKARQDFDEYIKYNSEDARVFINRAGTRFPQDLEGVVTDCNRAIELDPGNKNAYFLRGMALYHSGQEEKACGDFHKAIELGFTVLKEAEKERCEEFWKNYSDH